MTKLPTSAQIMHEVEAIKNYLSAAQDVVKSGHMPELIGLQERMALLCGSIQKADEDIQQKCLPHLSILLEQLNACDIAMRELHTKQTTQSKTQ